MNVRAVVLAAGMGKRMKSDLPKVLVPVLGRPMVEYVLDALDQIEVERTLLVVGYRAADVRKALAGRRGVSFIEQTEQRGTGHAVMMCREQLADWPSAVLILAGDSPMVEPNSLRALIEAMEREPASCILGTAHKAIPAGLGRIVRSADGAFQAIVEEKDATPEQRAITEVNLSCYLFRGPDLIWALDRLENKNAQGEFYLTDCPGLLHAAGRPVRALPVLTPDETLSINTPEELALVEAAMRKRTGK